jgi:hypothetical protein
MEEKGIEELPRWTEEELQGAAAIDEIYLANHPPPIMDRKIPQADKINWIYFKAHVLDNIATISIAI